MQAYELIATIDSDRQLTAQLPDHCNASQARIIVLLEPSPDQPPHSDDEVARLASLIDDPEMPEPVAVNRQPTFSAAALDTSGRRFNREDANER